MYQPSPSTRSHLLRKLTTAALPWLLIACGDDTASTASTAQLDQRLGAALCTQVVHCGLSTGQTLREHADDTVFALFAEAAPEACATFVATQLLPSHAALVEAGKVRFEAAELDACTAAIASNCDATTVADIPACQRLLVGQVAVGGVCDNTVECAGDAWCRPADAEGCAGTCTARIARGVACDDERACSQAAGPTTCAGEPSVCSAKPAAREALQGQPCGFDDPQDGRPVVCASGLACTVENLDAVCRPVLAPGSACGTPGAGVCSTGTACQLGQSGSPTCADMNVVAKAGDPCNEQDENQPYAICNRFLGLFCNDSKVCEKADGKAGSRCDLSLALGCAPGFACDFESETCTALAADGAACSSGDMCISNHCGDDGTCAPAECR